MAVFNIVKNSDREESRQGKYRSEINERNYNVDFIVEFIMNILKIDLNFIVAGIFSFFK
jgi:hypothetical protein